MSKKVHKIWQEIKYDEYLSHGHIFSFEKQLKFQGKIVLDYIVHESEETYKTFYELNINNNYNKEKETIIESSTIYDNKNYDNENHQLWNNKNLYREDYLDASYYEYLLFKEDGIYIIPYDENNIKLWT
jgi:hypothetical protein